MPRRKRIVIPNTPHHITQRGNRRQRVFFEDSQREYYLALLAENAQRYRTHVLSYCLMTNHVHLLLVPMQMDSLRWTLQRTHKQYADHINAIKGWSGHLWQQRFYSSPVDNSYFWTTLRYIQQNPVKAEMVSHPAFQYKWSSDCRTLRI